MLDEVALVREELEFHAAGMRPGNGPADYVAWLAKYRGCSALEALESVRADVRLRYGVPDWEAR